MHAGGAERVAGERLGRREGRHRIAEHLLHRAELGDVADRRRSAVRVDVVDGAVDRGQCLAHAARRAFAGRCDHVSAVGCGAVADDLGQDARTARLRVFERFDHDHAAAAGDDETVAVGVVGARGLLRRVVVFRRQRAHRVEHHRLRPVQLLAAAGEDKVLLAELDLLHRRADAMRRSGAGRGEGIVQAADAEGGGEIGRHGRAHRARDHVGTDATHAFLAQQVGRFHRAGAGAATGTGDDADARVGDGIGRQAGIGDRVLHRHVGVGGGIGHEASQLAIDARLEIDLGTPGDMAAETVFDLFRIDPDAGAALAQRSRDAGAVVAEAGRQAEAGDDDAFHADLTSNRWK